MARLAPAVVMLIALALGGCGLDLQTISGPPTATATNPPVGPTIPPAPTAGPFATATPETRSFTLDATTQADIDDALDHGKLSQPTYTFTGTVFVLGKVTAFSIVKEDVLIARYVASTLTPGGGVLVFVQLPFQGRSIVVPIDFEELPHGSIYIDSAGVAHAKPGWVADISGFSDGFPLSARGNQLPIGPNDNAAVTSGDMNTEIIPGTIVSVEAPISSTLFHQLASFLDGNGVQPPDVIRNTAAVSKPIVPASATPAEQILCPYFSPGTHTQAN